MNSIASDYKAFNDAEHIAHTLQGNAAGFDNLVRQYTGMVYAIALAHTAHRPEVAEELTQEVFLRAYLHLARLRRHEGFPAWLVSITRNLARDWQRRQRVSSGLVQMIPMDNAAVLDIPDRQVSPREAASRTEEDHRLRDALAGLPVADRELLLLGYAEGMTHSAIARLLGVHPSSVARRMDKALARLRAAYKADVSAGLAIQTRQPQLSARIGALIAALAALSATQRSALASSAVTVVDVKPVLLRFLPTGWAAVVIAAIIVGGVGSSLVMLSPAKDDSRDNAGPGGSLPRWTYRLAAVLGLDEPGDAPRLATVIHASGEDEPHGATGDVWAGLGDADDLDDTSHVQRAQSPEARPNRARRASVPVPAMSLIPDGQCPNTSQVVSMLSTYEKWFSNARLSYRRELKGPSSAPFFEAGDLHNRLFMGSETMTPDGVLLDYQEYDQSIDKPQHGKGVVYINSPNKNYILVEPHGVITDSTDVARVMKWYETCSPTHSLFKAPSDSYLWMSDFLWRFAPHYIPEVTCTTSDDGQPLWKIIGNDWGLEILPSVCNWPVRVYKLDSSDRPIFEMRVLTHARYDDVVYPSQFVSTVYGSDIHQQRIPIQITTFTLTLEQVGDVELPPYTPPARRRLEGVTTVTENVENRERREAEHKARIEEIMKRRRPAPNP